MRKEMWPILALTTSLLVSSARAECDATTTSEAETDFKNCIESAQTTIVSTAGEKTESLELCDSLNSTLSTCAGPKQRLAECKGRLHADKIEQLHLVVTADIVKTVNRDLDVQNCPIFKFEEPLEMGLVHNENDENEEDDDESSDSEPEDVSSSSKWRINTWLFLLAIMTQIRF